MKAPIYLDYNATTPVEPRVLEAMLPYFSDYYANASGMHSISEKPSKAINEAREQVAYLIKARSSEIIFTAGATEAINIALKGLLIDQTEKQHLITVSTEHKAVLKVAKYLERTNVEVTYLPVNKDGLINLDELKNAIQANTKIICIMWANNETGVIQDMAGISNIAKENNILFMTDATQALGKIPVSIKDVPVDILACSAHKLYGPKGTGVLYLNMRTVPKSKITPLLHGGGQESSIRSGTLNVPGIVGFGKACEIAQAEMKDESARVQLLRDELEQELLKIDDSWVNGATENRLPNTINIGFKGVNSEALISGLKEFVIASGSACSANDISPSHVLTAMGLSDDDAFSSVRISLGRCFVGSVEPVVEAIQDQVEKLRGMVLSIVWY